MKFVALTRMLDFDTSWESIDRLLHDVLYMYTSLKPECSNASLMRECNAKLIRRHLFQV